MSARMHKVKQNVSSSVFKLGQYNENGAAKLIFNWCLFNGRLLLNKVDGKKVHTKVTAVISKLTMTE